MVIQYDWKTPELTGKTATTVLDVLMAPKLFESQMTTNIIDGLYQSLYYKLIPSKSTRCKLTLKVNSVLAETYRKFCILDIALVWCIIVFTRIQCLCIWHSPEAQTLQIDKFVRNKTNIHIIIMQIKLYRWKDMNKLHQIVNAQR